MNSASPGACDSSTSVEDDDLIAIYSLAQVLAFPSVYEGFGFPPLEAMACGTAVVSSNAACMPEMLGPSTGSGQAAALLVPPLDVAQWVTALRHVLTDRGLRVDLQTRGPAHAARFNWQKVAEQTRVVYQQVVQN